MVTPSSLVRLTSATASTVVSISVPVLLPGTESTTTGSATTLAVLVSVVPASPAGIASVVKLMMLVPTAAIDTAVVQLMPCGLSASEVQVQSAACAPPSTTTPAPPPLTVTLSGRVSLRVTPMPAALGPALATVNV